MTELQLSLAIEDLLVARDLRHMRRAKQALEPGYYLRAARALRDLNGNVVIGTGFPVADSFETDGPVGAIALYRALEQLGAQPWLACAAPLAQALEGEFRLLELEIVGREDSRAQARSYLAHLQPQAVIAIERPGLCADERYYNMRGEDISPLCARFDDFLNEAQCPTIAIGDGGNEIGMGNIADTIAALDIRGATTGCDELLVADVSNWAAYGLLAFLGLWRGRDLLAEIQPLEILQFLSANGSVDGVTRDNTLTEDGLPASEGQAVITAIQTLVNEFQHGANTA